MPVTTPVLLIGAGPAGLAMAGRLHQAGLPYLLLEASDSLASSWRQHYDRVHLHTVKEHSHLPHRPFPPDYPRYVSRDQLVAYYEAYAREMGIHPRLGQRVTQLLRDPGGSWVATTQTGETYQAPQVVLCTGINREPHMPTWPGMDQYGGRVLHSRAYRNGQPFAGQSVLVVGMGNTGAELAIDLHAHGARPALSVRGPVNIVLRDFLGRPTQKTSMLLKRLPNWLADAIARGVSRWSVGDLRPYGLERPDIAPNQQLRETGKTPVIDVGTVPLIKAGAVRVFPGIAHFTPTGVTFTDGRTEAFDAVVLATGYDPALARLLPQHAHILRPDGLPPGCWSEAAPGLYFLGFDPFSSGILWGIYEDSARITAEIQRHQVPAGLAEK